MFKSSRSSYRSGRSLYQRKRNRPIPRWLILLAIPLSLITLELLVRLGAGVLGKTAELQSYQDEPSIISAYRLNYLDPFGKSYEGLSDRGRLQVRRSPVLGYRLVENQKSNSWEINPQGFRADQAIDAAKPKGETRIFVLGGSTAFGQLSSSNQTTFAAKLEERLNQQVATQKSNPGKFRPDVLPYYADELMKAMALPPRIRENRYRVINAAVPGYASSNELAQLALHVLSYKPDFIVLMNGYTDLLLPGNQEGSDIPGLESILRDAPGHFFDGLGRQFNSFVHQSFVVNGVSRMVRPPKSTPVLIPPTTDEEIPLTERLATDESELKRRVARYRNNLKQVARLTTAAKIPLIVALQPEISSREQSALQPPEKTVLERVGSSYLPQVKNGYAGLQESVEKIKQEFPRGVTTLNLYNFYANFPEQAFQDTVHLTDAANAKLADRLYEAIAPQLLLQPRPYGDSVPQGR
jgi:lysophospholipase L1-like esterase